MEQTEGPRIRNGVSEPSVALSEDHPHVNPSSHSGPFGFHNDEAEMDDCGDLDEIQEHTRCNSCWGRCMPRKCCQCWFDMWPCCRPVGMRIPRDDPLNPKTNMRLLFFTLLGIACGLIGGFIVRTPALFPWNCSLAREFLRFLPNNGDSEGD